MEEDVYNNKRDLARTNKFKEEYSTVANDLNFVFLWMQRELLASQTLSDLAVKNRRRKEDISPLINNVPLRRIVSQTKEEEDDEEDSPIYSSNETSSPIKEDGGEDSWSQYIPPSQTTCTTLETTNNTERNVMGNPNGAKILGDEMLDIAHALEDLHCEGGKKRTPNTPVESQAAPKPKKRRRRRHEISRNFKCSLNGCTKSYGSEGALKTHVRLKHAEGNEKKKDKERNTPTIWSSATLAGAPSMPQITNIFKSLAGDTQSMTQQNHIQRESHQIPHHLIHPFQNHNPTTGFSNHMQMANFQNHTTTTANFQNHTTANFQNHTTTVNFPNHATTVNFPNHATTANFPGHTNENLRLPPPNLAQTMHPPPSELPPFNFLFHTTTSGLTTH